MCVRSQEAAARLDGSQNCRHIIYRTPLVLQDIQADAAVRIDCAHAHAVCYFVLQKVKVMIGLQYLLPASLGKPKQRSTAPCHDLNGKNDKQVKIT